MTKKNRFSFTASKYRYWLKNYSILTSPFEAHRTLMTEGPILAYFRTFSLGARAFFSRYWERAGLCVFWAIAIFLTVAISSTRVCADDQVRVRKITIEIVEIFDEPDLGFLYRTANSLKVSTRADVIRRELLVSEGGVFNEFLLAESERNLRSLSFVRQVSITPLYDGNWVDLIVSVQDTWTLFPFLKLSSGGGTQKSAVGFTESNILGFGKRLEFLVADDEGRETVEAVWDDPRFWGTRNRFSVGHFQRSDGNRSVFSAGRPFRSLVEPYAWRFDVDTFDLVGRLFDGGDERFIFRQRHIGVVGAYTFARGQANDLLRRYSFGYGVQEDDFLEADEQDFEDIDLDPQSVSRDPNMLADDRLFSGPFFTYQRIDPDFLSINFVDRFERVEDFNLGNVFLF